MKLCLVCNFHFSDEQELCPKDSSQLVPISQDPLIGMLVQDRYKIDSVIGKGSMGIVYRATQELIGREVAVKVLHSHLVADSESLKRFHQQAKAASRLNHPHIITLYDYGVIDGSRPYIVMDLLLGTTLSKLLEERGNLTPEEAAPIFKQICEALGDAHKHGVVHRDVKPDNIVLEDHNNQKNFVKVVDFGIAKLIQGSEETLTRITRTGTVCGSPTYMSPEQFQGRDVDHRSDIYSLGTVLFETLTGRVPFTAIDLVSLMAQHVAEPPPKLSTVRPDLEFWPPLEEMVSRALAKDPDARQQSMDAFADDLIAALKEKGRTSRSGPIVDDVVSIAGKPILEPDPRDIVREVVAHQSSSKIQRPVEVEEPKREQRAPVSAKQQASTQKMTKARSAVPFHTRVVAFVQWMVPYILTLGLFATLLYLLSNDARVANVVDERVRPLLNQLMGKDQKPATQDTGDPQALFAEGKLSQARAILDARQEKGDISKDDLELLNRIYVRLAEQEAKAKHYKSAVKLLEKVSSKSAQASKAKQLLKKYKRLAPR